MGGLLKCNNISLCYIYHQQNAKLLRERNFKDKFLGLSQGDATYKDDQIPKTFSQEPSVPSKYDFDGKVFLTKFYAC